MSTHNICFLGDIRKNITLIPLLSGAMTSVVCLTADPGAFIHEDQS